MDPDELQSFLENYEYANGSGPSLLASKRTSIGSNARMFYSDRINNSLRSQIHVVNNFL